MRTWFHYFRVLQAFTKLWHSKLVIVYYLCLTQGMLKKGPDQLRVILTKAAKDCDLVFFDIRTLLPRPTMCVL